MQKIDHKKELKHLYGPSAKEVVQVDVPTFQFLMIDGDMTMFIANDKSKWKWTMMIMQPNFVSTDTVHAAIAEVKRKKSLPAVSKLRLENFTEGLCAQLLHIGPFSDEGPTIQKVHEFIHSRSILAGKHHEIYLSDIRRASPAKWKTIIRQAMK